MMRGRGRPLASAFWPATSQPVCGQPGRCPFVTTAPEERESPLPFLRPPYQRAAYSMCAWRGVIGQGTVIATG